MTDIVERLRSVEDLLILAGPAADEIERLRSVMRDCIGRPTSVASPLIAAALQASVNTQSEIECPDCKGAGGHEGDFHIDEGEAAPGACPTCDATGTIPSLNAQSGGQDA